MRVMVCHQDRSLFKGTTDGFAFFVSYHASTMMGRGDKAGVRELDVQKRY